MAISPILPVYVPKNIRFTHGEGSCLYDENDKKYVDFASGIAVNSLGYKNPLLLKALKEQADKLWHISNSYVIPQAVELARKLIEISFADTVFFTSSGAESIECGLKIVRSYQNGIGNKNRYRFITLKGAFHGRTFAVCSGNDSSKFSPLLQPYVDWYDNAEPNIESVRAAVNEHTGAILLEPVQGEGGINVLNKEFLQDLRKLCDEKGLLLFFDCVQCGAGRTGKFFAYEHYGVEPDVCALAKGIGGGFPLGVCLATEKAAQYMAPGMHGSTYGGNPLATAVGNAVVDELLQKGFLDGVTKKGHYLKKKLQDLANRFEVIEDVRGKGLMLGIKVKTDNKAFAQGLSDYGLLTMGLTGESVVRILPPLVITALEIDAGIDVLEKYLSENFTNEL